MNDECRVSLLEIFPVFPVKDRFPEFAGIVLRGILIMSTLEIESVKLILSLNEYFARFSF